MSTPRPPIPTLNTHLTNDWNILNDPNLCEFISYFNKFIDKKRIKTLRDDLDVCKHSFEWPRTIGEVRESGVVRCEPAIPEP